MKKPKEKPKGVREVDRKGWDQVTSNAVVSKGQEKTWPGASPGTQNSPSSDQNSGEGLQLGCSQDM
jgi:hypothetical protein